MDKKKGLVFSLRVRESYNDGSAKKYRMPAELVRLLGAGAKVVCHGMVTSLTANGRLDFTVRHGCLGDARPLDEGFAPTLTGTYQNIQTAGNFTFTISGDLMAGVDIEASVIDKSGTPVALESVTFVLWASVLPY